uniref:Uncharacterized protein n=1 Tax=Panagrolaimus sp. JU765 TaxID=591449 RepID=A0AC34QS83_9BILA
MNATQDNNFQNNKKQLLLDFPKVEAIYTTTWPWRISDLESTREFLLKTLKDVPVARSVVLEKIGLMVHMDYQIFTEGPKHYYGSRHFALHATVMELLKQLETYVDVVFGGFRTEVIQWAAKLLVDVLQYNLKRFRSSKLKPYDFLKRSEATKTVFKLMRTTTSKCLQDDCSQVFKAILEFYKEMKEFPLYDWLFNYMTKDFTVGVVRSLIDFGGKVLKNYAEYLTKNSEDVKYLEQYFSQEYSNLPRFYEYVAKTKEIETFAAIEQVLDQFYEGKLYHNFELIFLLYSTSSSPGLWHFYIRIIAPKVTKQKALKLFKILKDPFAKILKKPNGQSFVTAILPVLTVLTPDLSAPLLEILQPMAFDVSVLENASDFDFNEQIILRDCLKQCCNSLLDGFLKIIQEKRLYQLGHLPIFSALEKDDKVLRHFIELSTPVCDLSRQRLKLLHGFCYCSNIQFVQKVFSLFLCTIRRVEELKQFILFASTVITQYPSAMLDSIKDLFKRKNFYVELFEEDKMDFNVVRNVTMLLRWSELAAGNSYMDFFKLKSQYFTPQGSVMEMSGSLMKFTIALLLEHLEDCKEFNQDIFLKVCFATDLVKAIEGVTPMEPGAVHSISRIWASVYVNCLMFVKEQKTDPATLAIFKMNEAVRHLLTQQKFEFSKEAWAAALVQEILLCSKEVFGIGRDLVGMKNPYAEKAIEPCLLPEDNKHFEPEFCLLKNYYEKPATGLDQARTLAQTGVLSKSRYLERNQISDLSAPEMFRKHIFINTVDQLLTTPATNPNLPDISYDGSTLAQVASALVEVICGDKDLTSYYFWGDWIDDKHQMRDYVTITNNIESTPPCYDLMQVLAAGPSPTFFLMTPLIKSLLGSLINYCESSPIKDSKLPSHILKKVEKLFLLLILARIECKTILLSFEVLSRCSIHETGAVLFELWRMLMILKPSGDKIFELMAEINQKPSQNQLEETLTVHRDRVLSMLLNTCQRNIKKMVDLVPKIIALLSPEPETDIWVNELYPVGAVTGDLKRA